MRNQAIRVLSPWRPALAVAWIFVTFEAARAADSVAPIRADEPLRETLSLEKAAKYLDRASLAWQRERECATCHTNFAHVMLRSALGAVVPEPPEVRAYVEGIVEERWPAKGPRWDAEVVVAATTLAWNDRAREPEGESTRLSRATRAAFERMAKLQREDGGWSWLKCGWPPMESDDHYGVTFAALGLGAAPAEFQSSDLGRQLIAGVRRYLRQNPGPTLHHRGMVLWASRHLEGLVNEKAREQLVADFTKLQLTDGGWAVASLFQGWKDHARKDDRPPSLSLGDGYGTAFAIVVLRAAQVPASDPRLRRALAWLGSHQRASGRWFTPSPTKDSKHFLSNAGTALAAHALALCDAVPEAPKRVRRRRVEL